MTTKKKVKKKSSGTTRSKPSTPKKKAPSAVSKKTSAKPARTKSAIGRQARAFGHAFERDVVHEFKEHFRDEAWAENLRRSDQSHRAWLPDVTGVPGLWIECQVAQHIQPEVKLKQAIRDTAKFKDQNKLVMPVAITRRKGQQMICATLTAWDLSRLMASASDEDAACDPNVLEELKSMAVSIGFDGFLAVFKAASLHNDPEYAKFVLDTEALRAGLEGELPQTITRTIAHVAEGRGNGTSDALLDTAAITSEMNRALAMPRRAPRQAPKLTPDQQIAVEQFAQRKFDEERLAIGDAVEWDDDDDDGTGEPPL